MTTVSLDHDPHSCHEGNDVEITSSAEKANAELTNSDSKTKYIVRTHAINLLGKTEASF